MKRATCPVHPGRLVDKHPCAICNPDSVGESPAPRTPLALVQSQEQEEAMTPQTATAELETLPDATEETTGDGTWEALPEIDESSLGHCRKHDAPAPLNATCLDTFDDADYVVVCTHACDQWMPPVLHAAMAEPEDAPKRDRPDYAVIDRNTGEIGQLSLLGAEWEQYRIGTVRLSLSGGDEFIKELFDQLVDGELSPGAIVEVNARGIVQQHSPVFKKGGHEGKTVILLEVVRTIKVMGHAGGGKMESAQNVDGEPKVLEEDAPGTEALAGESFEAEKPPCFGCNSDKVPADAACEKTDKSCEWEEACTEVAARGSQCWLGLCAQYSEDDKRQSLCLFDESKPLPVTGVTECPHVDERESIAAYADSSDVEHAGDEA